MKLGIMQPYFFPYLGYFQLISAVDRWVVFDNAQYMRHGWISRNRILHPQAGPKYIAIPLKKHAVEVPINRVQVDSGKPWRERILAQLQNFYPRRAPGFSLVMDMVGTCLDQSEGNLSRILVDSLAAVCQTLELDFSPVLASSIGVDPNTVGHAGQWALRISEQLNASIYINPEGGRELFQPKEFAASGIELKFLSMGNLKYSQGSETFCPNLSILDVLIWNGPEKARALLDHYTLST